MSGLPPAPRSGPSPGLSPVPDDAMGQPVPPRAPRVLGPWAGHARRGRRTKSWRPARKTPYRRRTALEFVSARRQHGLRYHITDAIILLIILVVFLYVTSLIFAEGDLWSALPLILFRWVIVAGLYYVVSRKQAFYVGATWITKYLKPPLGLLEGNPNLWDYVYNGLVHSAANGAEVDPLTRGLLQLPGPGAAGG